MKWPLNMSWCILLSLMKTENTKYNMFYHALIKEKSIENDIFARTENSYL